MCDSHSPSRYGLRFGVARKIKKLWGRTFPESKLAKQWKRKGEMSCWLKKFQAAGGSPLTEWYRKRMMDMGDIKDQSFFDDRICLDIGCGPRGSLTWLTNARCAIGLDPLAEEYMRFGIGAHDMVYVLGSGEHIPFPSRYVDVVFCMNALDHVDDAVAVCTEIRRVLKPGGYFIGSLNLDEPATITEPFMLTEKFLERHLFAGWEKEFYQIRPKVHGQDQDVYRYFYEDCPDELVNTPGPRALWCRMRAT